MKHVLALPLAIVASASMGGPVSVTAVGLDAHDGAVLEFGYADPRNPDGFEVLGLALVEEGRAELRADIDTALATEFIILADDGDRRVRGIVEPGGEHRLSARPDGALTFSGGRYQSLIAPSPTPSSTAPTETHIERMRQIYRGETDPLARVLALREAWKDRNGAWRDTEDAEQMAVLAELGELAPVRDDLNVALINAVLDQRDAAAARAIKDFQAPTLAGRDVRLRDVLRQNKYTLVEFWASWCGPCIAEIPHLQTAYERFRAAGFEILSVNLDEDRAAWRQASVDDYAIGWLNVSDGHAFASPVAKLYRVRGIPANFLVAADGKTVARHLRGEALSEKLADLLDG